MHATAEITLSHIKMREQSQISRKLMNRNRYGESGADEPAATGAAHLRSCASSDIPLGKDYMYSWNTLCADSLHPTAAKLQWGTPTPIFDITHGSRLTPGAPASGGLPAYGRELSGKDSGRHGKRQVTIRPRSCGAESRPDATPNL